MTDDDSKEFQRVRTALIDVLGEGNTDEDWAECAARIVRSRDAWRERAHMLEYAFMNMNQSPFDVENMVQSGRLCVVKNDGDVEAVSYMFGPMTINAVMKRLHAYFDKHQAYNGESICQNDGPQMDAPQVLADIADDLLQFKVTWRD